MAWKGALCHSRVPFLTFYFPYPYLSFKEKGALSKAINYFFYGLLTFHTHI